jgi:hypothetical protein
MIRRLLPASVALLLLLTAPLAAAVKFTSTWKAPGPPISFFGQKVAVLLMADDLPLRMSTEEALVREITPRGPQAVAAYTLIPPPELRDVERAKGWFERAGVQGVIVLRPLGIGKEVVEQPVAWTSPYYGSFWGYYGYGWSTLYTVDYREDTVVAVETLVFSVAKDSMLWAGRSESRNPKDLQALVKDLVKESVKEMQKQGLIARK